jgi:hypothetical protein
MVAENHDNGSACDYREIGRFVFGAVDDFDPEGTDRLEPGEAEASQTVFMFDQKHIEIPFGQQPMKFLARVVHAASKLLDDSDHAPSRGGGVFPEPLRLARQSRPVLGRRFAAIDGASTSISWRVSDLRLELRDGNKSPSRVGDDGGNLSGVGNDAELDGKRCRVFQRLSRASRGHPRPYYGIKRLVPLGISLALAACAMTPAPPQLPSDREAKEILKEELLKAAPPVPPIIAGTPPAEPGPVEAAKPEDPLSKAKVTLRGAEIPLGEALIRLGCWLQERGSAQPARTSGEL